MPIVRRKALLLIWAVLAGYLAAVYFVQYPVPFFWLRLREIGTAAVFALLCLGVGARLARLLEVRAPRAELAFWDFGLGAAALSASLLLLGLAGGFRPVPMVVLSAAAALACRRETARWARRFWQAPARLFKEPVAGPALPILLYGLSILSLAVLCALAPPTYYDSVVYHLALPAKYLQEGRVGFVPYNHYSHFPQAMEMIFGWFLALGDDVSAQLFCVLTAALTGGLVFVLGRDLFRLRGFRWDLLLFLSAPSVILLSSETYVDAPLAFFTTLSVAACARGLLQWNRRWLALAGLLGGAAAAVKYTGILTPVLLTALAALWPGGARSPRRRAGDTALIALPSFLVFLPWMAKNFVFTGGNPVFPFFPGIFPARNVYLPEESSRAYFQVLDEYKGSSPLLTELFLMPFRLASDALSFGGGFDVTGDLGWVLPILLLPLAAGALKGPHRAFFAAYALAHAALWAGLRPVLRFLFPLFPILCLLAGMGWSRVYAGLSAWGRGVSAAVVAGFCLSNAVLFYLVERVRDPFPAAAGIETREAYLRRKLDAWPAWDYINRNLPADSRVLVIGDQRGYYIQRPYLAPMALLPTPLKEWAGQSADGADLRRRLAGLGFTHLFFNRREAERLESYRVLDLTDQGRAAWNDLLKGLPRLYEDPGAAVYSLL
ncbi:MAG: ArnT family glycosyltransferase [Elusimicrobiota bacterium]